MDGTSGGDRYANVADSYNAAEELLYKRYAEMPTWLGQLGSLHGADVLDLACGTGSYSRALAGLGARSVLGVDSSAAMIAQAGAATDPSLPIRYEVGDATELSRYGEFDHVNASWLLDYAADREQLAAMCRTIADQLKPGGRFSGVLPRSEYDYSGDLAWDSRYGAMMPPPPGGLPLEDGDTASFVLLFEPPVEIAYHFWTSATYRQALLDAGLRDIRFVDWSPSKEGLERFGTDFWRLLRDNSAGMVVTAQKPGEPAAAD